MTRAATRYHDAVPPSDAARILSIGPIRVHRLANRGVLTAIERDGRRLITLESIENYKNGATP